MTKNIFLDINVIIDFLDKKRPRHLQTIELFQYLTIHNYTLFAAEDMLTTVYYIIKDKKAALQFFKMILKRWHIVAFGHEVVSRTIELSLDKEIDFEDVLQCLCAKENGCTVLITNDAGFYDCGVDRYSTGEFLAKMNG